MEWRRLLLSLLKLLEKSIDLNLNNSLDNLNNKRNSKKVIVLVTKWLEFEEIPSLTNPLMRLPKSREPPKPLQNQRKEDERVPQSIKIRVLQQCDSQSNLQNHCADPQ